MPSNDVCSLILAAFAVHCITVYAVLKLCITGRPAWFERKGDKPHE